MNKIFKYIGVISLMCFSFYYTDKVVQILNENDEIMTNIKEYAKDNNISCVEGYITEEGVVLGVSGKEVDEDMSYSEMKMVGFDTNLIQYKNTPCIVSKDNNKDDYIIKGNETKKSISLIISVTNGKNIKNIIETSKIKGVNLSILIDENYFKNNLEYIISLIKNNNDILYKGKSEDELKRFIKLADNKEFFCVYDGDKELLNYCYKNGLNTIKTNKVYDSKYYTSIKQNIDIGDFIILEESVVLKDEIGVIINYIRSKGIKIVTINEHLGN